MDHTLRSTISVQEMRKSSDRLKLSEANEASSRINLTLECYLALQTDSLQYCLSCQNFQSCRSYLMVFKKDGHSY